MSHTCRVYIIHKDLKATIMANDSSEENIAEVNSFSRFCENGFLLLLMQIYYARNLFNELAVILFNLLSLHFHNKCNIHALADTVVTSE